MLTIRSIRRAALANRRTAEIEALFAIAEARQYLEIALMVRKFQTYFFSLSMRSNSALPAFREQLGRRGYQLRIPRLPFGLRLTTR